MALELQDEEPTQEDLLEAMTKEDLKCLFWALIPIVKLDNNGKHLLGTQVKTFHVSMD